jgi:hypothetical protein
MNYNNYPSFGIDSSIKMLQNIIATKLELESVDFYGRVQRTLSKDLKTKIPTTLISSKDYKEVYYDDANAPGGNVFFIDSEKHTSKDGIIFKSEIKIVFMLNLDKVLSKKEYRADAQIQEYCIKLVRKTKMIEITGIDKELNSILKGFDVSSIKMSNINPYHIFSIDGNLTYKFNC